MADEDLANLAPLMVGQVMTKFAHGAVVVVVAAAAVAAARTAVVVVEEEEGEGEVRAVQPKPVVAVAVMPSRKRL